MGNNHSHDQLYMDFDSRMVKYVPTFVHNASNEAEYVSTNDEIMRGGDECYLVSTQWVRAWISYTKSKGGRTVGPITNEDLVEYDESRTPTLRSGALLGRDFVPLCKAVWEYYFMAYGGGPVIALQGAVYLLR